MKKTKLAGTMLASLALTVAAVFAYTSAARDSLLRSRDQVADQKYKLQQAYNDIDRKIQDLERQKYNIGLYLTDCDKTLRDIDRALSAQDTGYNRLR